MKFLVPLVPFSVMLYAIAPGGVAAQVRIPLSRPWAPAARAEVGPWSVSATVGGSGVDVRVVPRTRAPARGPTSPAGRRVTASVRAARILGTADDYVGTRYVYGGTTPEGFDCSGFVQYVFQRHGVDLPRTSRQQAKVGRNVGIHLNAVRPGDLLMFASSGTRIDHVAIYAGQNRIIHSSSSGGGVRYDSLGTKRGRWFAIRHVASRRILADGRTLVAELTAGLRASAPLDPPDRAPRP